MRLKTTQWVTIVKDNLNHPYYTGLIGNTYRVISIIEREEDAITNRRTTNRETCLKPKKIFFSISAKRHCFKPQAPTHGKYSLWSLDEIRAATPEEATRGMMLECAEKI